MTTFKMIQRYSLRNILKYDAKNTPKVKIDSNDEVSFLSWCKASIHALMRRKYTELLTAQTVVGDETLYQLIP